MQRILAIIVLSSIGVASITLSIYFMNETFLLRAEVIEWKKASNGLTYSPAAKGYPSRVPSKLVESPEDLSAFVHKYNAATQTVWLTGSENEKPSYKYDVK